jgi:hypothetical protein
MDDSGAAGGLLIFGFTCLCVLVILGVHIAITYWIYNDAKKRGNPNAVIWAIVNLLSDPLGLILYLIIGRNQVASWGGPPAAGSGPPPPSAPPPPPPTSENPPPV